MGRGCWCEWTPRSLGAASAFPPSTHGPFIGWVQDALSAWGLEPERVGERQTLASGLDWEEPAVHRTRDPCWAPSPRMGPSAVSHLPLRVSKGQSCRK